MSDNIFRMALAINTSHDSFVKNLSNILVYLLYNDGKPQNYTIAEFKQQIEQNIFLEFTEEEIASALKKCEENRYVHRLNNEKYVLDKNGHDSINKNNDEEIKKLIEQYISAYEIADYSIEDIFQLLCSYLYNLLNSNINALLYLLDGQSKRYLESELDDNIYTEEQKVIINEFLDWENKEKNEILYKLIAFSVDYCRLTTKKDINSFSAIFKGKKFYIDANIIYRLMGINNEARKKAMQEFVGKCNEIGVQLCYTNVTYKELVDSFEYYVDKLKMALEVMKAAPSKVYKLYNRKSDNGFYELYYQWAGKTNSYGNWTQFLYFLKDELRKTIISFSKVTISNYKIFEKEEFPVLVEELENYKKNRRNAINTNRINIEYDINNILHILHARNQHGKSAWEINDYIISADHALAKWAEKMYPGEIPIVVLPSIWYSLLLKISGRTDDDYKAYVEFMKLRYSQNTDSTPEQILSEITYLTENGDIQNRIIDILIDENDKVLSLHEMTSDEIKDNVRKAYDRALEEAKRDEYADGYNRGRLEGYQEMTKEAERVSFEKGKKVGELENKKRDILNRIERNVKKKRIKHIIILGIGIVFILIATIIFCFWVWSKMPNEKAEKMELILAVVPMILDIVVIKGVIFILPINYDDIEKKEKSKFVAELNKIEEELSELM